MKFEEAKDKYIEAWGSLGSNWGVNRTMAQIHALLLISTEPLSTEEIMEELQISRGNANMNMRALLDWGLGEKVLIKGERKEFFKSEKDIFYLAQQVARERKKRELDPILKILSEVQGVEGSSPEIDEFNKMTGELLKFSKQSEKVLTAFTCSSTNWFMKLIKWLKL
jgi:DNA-binding transcriptional regulator GbsR (MarR family)